MALPQGSLVLRTHIGKKHIRIFSSETTGPVKAEFHMESPWAKGRKGIMGHMISDHAHIW